MFALFASHILADCSITIKNYQDVEITADSYSTNTQAFKIYPSEECTELKVNNEAFNTSKGIYQLGEYTITASTSVSITVKIVEVPANERHIYYIMAHAGSFPIMYSTFNVIFDRKTDDNIHISIGRSFQFDYEELKKKYTNLVFSNNTDSTEILNFVKETAKTDPKSYFIVSVDDMRVHLPIVWIINQGIPTNRYQINLITDGTSTYNYFYEGSFNKTDNLKALFEQFKGTYEHHATGQKTTLGLHIGGGDIVYQMFPASSYDNFKLYLTNPDVITSSEEEAKTLIGKFHLEKIDLYGTIDKQTPDNKAYMFKLCNFSKDDFEKEYFKDGKELIMILGHGKHKKYPGTIQFETSNINQAIAKFPNNSFFFKPHPANVPEGELADWMNANGVKFFTQRINAEIIFSAFKGKMKLGGYETTTYLTADTKDIAFLYINKTINEFAAPFPQFAEAGVYKDTPMLKYSDDYIPEKFRNTDKQLTPSGGPSKFVKIGVPIIVVFAVIGIVGAVVAVWFIKKKKGANKVSVKSDDEKGVDA